MPDRNNAEKSITIADMGVTVRTLLAIAAEGYTETDNRKWKICYKGAIIGSLTVKDSHLKDKNVNSERRTVNSPARLTAQKTVTRTSLVVHQRPPRRVVDKSIFNNEGRLKGCVESSVLSSDSEDGIGNGVLQQEKERATTDLHPAS